MGAVTTAGWLAQLTIPSTPRAAVGNRYTRFVPRWGGFELDALEADMDENLARVWVASADSESADFAADQARMDLHDAMTEALEDGADPQSVWAASNATDSDMMRDQVRVDGPESA